MLPNDNSRYGDGGSGGAAEEAEAGRPLPSPPMSPPDAFASSAPRTDVPRGHLPTPGLLSYATERTWRLSHARNILGFAYLMVPLGPAVNVALACSETNEGSRIYLLSWGLGWLPAALLVLASYDRDGDDGTGASPPVPHSLLRMLDLAACSLSILPQLILLALTWDGVADPMDAHDVNKGAETFGKCFAGLFFAHLYLQINSTDYRMRVATLLSSAALLAFQAPISTTPAAELALCRKGIVAGLVGGYSLHRMMRQKYFMRQRRPMPSHTYEGRKLSVDMAVGLTGWRSEPALEQEYRDWLFERSHDYIGCMTIQGLAQSLWSYLEGDYGLGASLVVFVLLNLSYVARIAVHSRGNRRDEMRIFRALFPVYCIVLLVAKLFMPSLTRGGCGSDTLEDGWLFMQPVLLAVQGPSAPIRWLFSATAVVMGENIAGGWSWRANQVADATVLRATVLGGEILAFMIDRAARAHFRRTRLAAAQEAHDLLPSTTPAASTVLGTGLVVSAAA